MQKYETTRPFNPAYHESARILITSKGLHGLLALISRLSCLTLADLRGVEGGSDCFPSLCLWYFLVFFLGSAGYSSSSWVFRHLHRVCSLHSAVLRPNCHLFVCCRLTTELLNGSCVLLFCHDGWGTPFTWAKSGLHESAVTWVRRFTHSRGLHYLSQEWHIQIEECGGSTIWSMLYEINHRKNVGFWLKEIWRVTELT